MSRRLDSSINALNGLLGALGDSVQLPGGGRRHHHGSRGHVQRRRRERPHSKARKKTHPGVSGRRIGKRVDKRHRSRGSGGDHSDEIDDFGSFLDGIEGEENEEENASKSGVPCMLPAYEREYELEKHDMEHEFGDDDESSPCIFCKYGDELGRNSMNKIQETHSRIMEILRSNMGNANKEELFRQAQETWKDRISSVFRDKGIPVEEWKITDLRRHFGSITNPKMHYIDPELITSEMIRLTHSIIVQFIHELMLQDNSGEKRVNKEANAQLGRTIRNLIWLMMKLEYFRGVRRRESEKNTRHTPPGEDFFSGGGSFEGKFVAIPKEISDAHRSTFYDDFDD